jgi:hypothetical protein
VTRARLELEAARLVTAHPGWSTAQLAYVLAVSEERAAAVLGVIMRQGRIEQADGGWWPVTSAVRSWRKGGE